MPLDYEKDERAPLPFCEDVEAANAKKATAASAAHRSGASSRSSV